MGLLQPACVWAGLRQSDVHTCREPDGVHKGRGVHKRVHACRWAPHRIQASIIMSACV